MDEIISGVHMVSSVNSYIIDGDEGVTLIDTLMPKNDQTIAKALTEIGRSLADVTAIVVTHSHLDHTGSAAAIKAVSGASVYAPTGDVAAVRGEEKPPLPPLADRFPFLKPIMNRFMPIPDGVGVEYELGESLDTKLPADLKVIDTPGHTPGHVSLDRDGGLLFVGDAALTAKGRIVRGYMNRAEPTFDASIGHIAEHGFEKAVFGHSPPLRTGASQAFSRFTATLS